MIGMTTHLFSRVNSLYTDTDEVPNHINNLVYKGRGILLMDPVEHKTDTHYSASNENIDSICCLHINIHAVQENHLQSSLLSEQRIYERCRRTLLLSM